MVHRFRIRSACSFAGLVLLAAACGTGGTSSNAAPRIETIPAHSTTGGSFSVDLSTYVTDRENTTITYTVLSGGGSFTGSTYTHTFDTMGSHTVAFRATDADGKATDGSFDVDVTTGDFLVVRQDTSGLQLLDVDTQEFVTVAASVGTPGFGTGLADGRLVYQLGSGSNLQLWAFDPMTRTSTRIAGTKTYVTYRTKTSDGKVVYTTGAPTDTDLWIFNPRTGLSTEISAQPGEIDGSPFVSVDDLVFYQRGSNGQADVWYYDPSTGDSTVVADNATAETIQAVLATGGVVYSRLGGSGETDLFYFSVAGGEVEIGANFATQSKTYCAATTGGKVVFTATDGVTTDIAFWNAGNGQNTVIETDVTAFAALGAGNEVVYTDGTAVDFYDLDDASAATLGAAHNFLAVNGGYAILESNSTPGNLSAVSMIASPVATTATAGGAVEVSLVLANGDVVLRKTNGTRLEIWDASGTTWHAIVGAGYLVQGLGIDTGDFVFSYTASSQQDLMMWDSSANGVVVLSSTTGDDAFQASSNGKVFFTRTTDGKNELFVYDVAGTTETQLTTTDGAGLGHDHAVLGAYAGSR